MSRKMRRGTAMTVTADPAAVSIAAAIRSAARLAPLLIVSGRAFRDLTAELGSPEAAAAFLLALAEDLGRPIGLNLPTGLDTSSTAFIPPRSWSAERLQGWVAGHHQELEQQFGGVTGMGADPGRRKGDR